MPQVLLFLCSWIVLPLSAHQLSQPSFREIESYLLELRLSQAESLIRQVPDPAYRAFYQNNANLYRALSSMDPGEFSRYRNSWEAQFDAVDDLPERDSLREVMLADLSAKRAIVEFMDHNFLTSVRYVRSARKYLDASYAQYGRMVEQLKLEGLFEVLLGSLPEKYHWIAHPLGLEGDVATGMRYLRISAGNCRLLQAESYLLLALIEKNILDQPEQTLHRLSRYQHRLPRKAILIDFFLASCHQRIKQNDESLAILSDRSAYPQGEISSFPFWYYLAGKAWYFNGNMGNARQAFASFLHGYEGQLFRTDATFRTGMSWLLSGNEAQARQYFSRIVNSGEDDQFDEDEYAAAMSARFLAQSPGPVLLDLFRARNAYDGGYLNLARSTLEQINAQYALQPAEWVEWHYRMGRIEQESRNLSLAADHYQQSLNYSADRYTSWLQAYGCFYLGEIAVEAGHRQEARTWIGKALEYDDYFYQSGLENRCKSTLSELKSPQVEASSNRR